MRTSGVYVEAEAVLLRDALGLVLPVHNDARVDESDFTQLVPAESRADLVVTLLRDATPVMGIVVETQLARKLEKRFAWPLRRAIRPDAEAGVELGDALIERFAQHRELLLPFADAFDAAPSRRSILAR